MQPGEHRVIRVPVAEADEFFFEEGEAPTEAHFPAGVRRPPLGYEFGPGDAGDDVLLAPPSRMTTDRRSSSANSCLLFDVDMIKVETADVDLTE